MATKHFDWSNDLPVIPRHSITKLEVLREYLIEYFMICAKNPRLDNVKLTIVDGFAAGGLYRSEENTLVKGSPLVCLEAVKEAEYRIQQYRQKPFKLLVNFIFIEKNRISFNHLKKVLNENGHGSDIGKNIHLLNGEFQNSLSFIHNAVQKHTPKTSRAIFILDQYGYMAVPGQIIKEILSKINRPEIILTFFHNAIFTYASETTKDSLKAIGLDGENIMAGHKTLPRITLQSRVLSNLIQKFGAPFYTSFFIRPAYRGHGDYWLLHLSKHATARNAMTEIHYKYHNNFRHYGDAGLDMFMSGYDAQKDIITTKQLDFGMINKEFDFDTSARALSVHQVMLDIPKYLSQYQALTFQELFISVCNHTPATLEMIKESLGLLLTAKEIEVIGTNSEIRRSGNSIQDTDIIMLARQKKFIF